MRRGTLFISTQNKVLQELQNKIKIKDKIKIEVGAQWGEEHHLFQLQKKLKLKIKIKNPDWRPMRRRLQRRDVLRSWLTWLSFSPPRFSHVYFRQSHIYTNTQIHKYTNVQIQIHKYTNDKNHRSWLTWLTTSGCPSHHQGFHMFISDSHTYIQIHKYTNIQMYKYKYTNIQMTKIIEAGWPGWQPVVVLLTTKVSSTTNIYSGQSKSKLQSLK